MISYGQFVWGTSGGICYFIPSIHTILDGLAMLLIYYVAARYTLSRICLYVYIYSQQNVMIEIIIHCVVVTYVTITIDSGMLQSLQACKSAARNCDGLP